MTNAADVRPPWPTDAKYLTASNEISEARQLAAKAAMSDTTELVGQADATRFNMARAIDRAPVAMSGFSFLGGKTDRERAVQCLAEAAFFEAGNDPAGQRAVMQVVLNRVRHPVYPSTVCGVVFEGSTRQTGCQFTFTCDGSRNRRWSESGVSRARKLAAAALDGYVDKAVGTATHYHASYVVPYWSASLSKIAVVGQHLFYTFPHTAGSRSSFRSGGGRNEPAIPGIGDIPDELEVQVAADLKDAALDVAGIKAVGQPVLASDITLFAIVDPNIPSGRWAVNALASCAGRPVCEVFAYTSQDAMQADMGLPKSRRRPVFTLLKDTGAGVEQARWDCRISARSKAEECMVN